MAELLSVAADVSCLGGIEEIALLFQLGLSIRFQVDAPLQKRGSPWPCSWSTYPKSLPS